MLKKLVQNVPIFGGLDDRQLKLIVGLARTEKFRKGALIFRQGETATDIYIIREGTVEVAIEEDGEVIPLAVFREGDSFGEMSIIEVAPQFGSARAKVNSTILCLSLSALFKLYERDPATFALIILNVARELSRRLHKADKKLVHYYHEGYGRGAD
jgi:CRP/FNR family cyclic AMP-dependent transcriptional regulator